MRLNQIVIKSAFLLVLLAMLSACGGGSTTPGEKDSTPQTNIPDTKNTDTNQPSSSATDSTAPVIRLVGNSTVNITQGSVYVDAGAAATDNIDGDISSKIQVTGAVDTQSIGAYTITYNVSDSSNNAAVAITRIINVSAVQDSIAPVIVLNGAASVTVIQGTTYIDAGASATDNIDGDISNKIQKTGTVDTSAIGVYTLTYQVSDAANNTAIPVVRTVNVIEVPDTIAPTITLKGDSVVTLTQGTSYVDLGASAMDNKDGDISARIQIANNVNVNVIGSYTVTYNVKDAANNAAISVFRTVNIVAVLDTIAPVITLVGDATVPVLQGTSYVDAGAKANDNRDGDISSKIQVSGSVDAATLGNYTLTYNVADSAGNAAVAVSRTVQVVLRVVAAMPPLNDTGILWGGNYPAGNNGGCIGDTVSSQDCTFGRDASAQAGNLIKTGGGEAGFDFSKIGSDGSVLVIQNQAYDEAGLENTGTKWSCVKDNRTGLLWEVKTNTLQGTDLHSKYDTYNWYNTNTIINGGGNGFADDDGNVCTGYDSSNATTFCNTQAFIARVNAQGLCGAHDWRLPNPSELQSIANMGHANPAIDQSFFPNTMTGSNPYWSSSPSQPLSSVSAWGVIFIDGSKVVNDRNLNNYIRLVRGGG